MKVDNIIKVKAELTGDEFLRAVLLEIAAAKPPADIFTSAAFGKPQLTTEEVIITSAKVNLDYTCEIGYDRSESYYDSISKTTKTRNVIDWRPFSGRAGGNETTFVINGETDARKAYDKEDDLYDQLKSIGKESYVVCEGGHIEVDAETIDVIEKVSKSQCFKKVNLPGLRQRLESYTGTVEVETRKVWEVPQYSLEYTYGDKKYSAKACAAGNCKVRTEAPDNVCELKMTDRKKLMALLFCGLLLAALGVILSAAKSVPQGVWIAIFAVGLIILCVFFIMWAKRQTKAAAENREIRIEGLKTLLKQLRLNPLTESEREAIVKKLPMPAAKAKIEK